MDEAEISTFVHAADLHLGAPLHSLGRRIDSAKAEHLRKLAASAFDRLVSLTIQQKSKVLVLAGDVYDHAEREIAAQLRFQQGMQQLCDEGVKVFIAHGNHDPLVSSYRPAAKLPDNVVVFEPGAPQVHEVELADGSTLNVCGTSFSKSAETENLARRFHGLSLGTERSVAVLHANLAGTSGHDNYAPCTVDDLAGADNVAYWALGHIHARTVAPLGPGRWYAYPGNLQGRSTKPTECGAKGALVVPLTRHGISEPKFEPCDAVRFVRLDVDVSAAQDAAEALDIVNEQCALEVGAAEDRPILARVMLCGASHAHSQLLEIDDLVAVMRERVAETLGDGDIVNAKVATRIHTERAQLLERGDLLSELLVELDALRAAPDELAERIGDLKPAADKALAGSEAYPELLDEVERILIDRLELP